MNPNNSFAAFSSHLRAFIERFHDTPLPNGTAEHEFNDLALALFRLQFDAVPVFRQVCLSRGVSPITVQHWSAIPAMPTASFKEHEVSSLAPAERTHVFHSSGTTQQIPSRHFHSLESLALYEASLLPWFNQHFLPCRRRREEANQTDSSQREPDQPDTLRREPDPCRRRREEANQPYIQRLDLLILTPSPALAPNSSLVHMFDVVRHAFQSSLFVGRIESGEGWTLDMESAINCLQKATSPDGARNSFRTICSGPQPLALVGTAFSFVHLLDYCHANKLQWKLPSGSRALETGGYKGRSRVLSKSELHKLITKYLGIPDSHIVSEYGMSELSSQAYDRRIGGTTERVFHFPPWARAQIISPETGTPVGDGETGLIRIFDLANVRSLLAIQTEDLAIRRASGFELLGRAALAEPRGCSLMPA